MHLNEYQHEALNYRLESADQGYVIFGLIGEIGELYGMVAKSIRDNDSHVDHQLFKKELGDILWFLSALAYDNGLTLEDVARENLDKLESRAQRGKIQGSGDER